MGDLRILLLLRILRILLRILILSVFLDLDLARSDVYGPTS